MSVLSFDEATHTYRFGGQVVPGVTSILSPLTDFSRVPPHVLQAAADFGKAVHRACELDDLGELDEATLDDALLPYLQAWRKFSAEHAGQYLKKGALVYVSGKITTRKYTDKDGAEKYSTEIRADNMKMLSGRDQGTEAPAQRQAPAATPRPAPAPSPSGFDDFDDDIPF